LALQLASVARPPFSLPPAERTKVAGGTESNRWEHQLKSRIEKTMEQDSDDRQARVDAHFVICTTGLGFGNRTLLAAGLL